MSSNHTKSPTRRKRRPVKRQDQRQSKEKVQSEIVLTVHKGLEIEEQGVAALFTKPALQPHRKKTNPYDERQPESNIHPDQVKPSGRNIQRSQNRRGKKGPWNGTGR